LKSRPEGGRVVNTIKAQRNFSYIISVQYLNTVSLC
jgi:hypothetical protein